MVGSHARARTFARKGTIMAHAPQIFDVNSDIPLFDGFPYLITRVSPALYHIMLLPARTPSECQKLLIRQVEANRLETCLVLGRRSAVFAAPDGSVIRCDRPPSGGVMVSKRLRPCEDFVLTPDLTARSFRLARLMSKSNPRDGYLHGDLTKGGRKARAGERRALAGFQRNGVPVGLEWCQGCGEWWGECLDPSPEFKGMVTQVNAVARTTTGAQGAVSS